MALISLCNTPSLIQEVNLFHLHWKLSECENERWESKGSKSQWKSSSDSSHANSLSQNPLSIQTSVFFFTVTPQTAPHFKCRPLGTQPQSHPTRVYNPSGEASSRIQGPGDDGQGSRRVLWVPEPLAEQISGTWATAQPAEWARCRVWKQQTAAQSLSQAWQRRTSY